jgi:tetratricopeptide (TPR) repeat protein
MQGITTQDLDTLLENYEVGCAKPVQDNDVFEAAMRQKMDAMFADKLPRFDFRVISRTYRLSHEGVDKVKRGCYEEASDAFRQAQTLMDSYPLIVAGRRIALAQINAAESYLDYRRGRFAAAEQRLRTALACEDVLENDLKYLHYHIHRVHLVENLSRIFWFSSSSENASALMGCLIGYLHGARPDPGVGGHWSKENLNLVERDILRQKFAQIFSTFAMSLQRLNTQEALPALMRLLDAAGAPPSEWLLPQCAEWIDLKLALFHSDRTEFLARAARYLAAGGGGIPVLWTLTAAEAAGTCRRAGWTNHPLQQRIERDLARVASPILKSVITKSLN